MNLNKILKSILLSFLFVFLSSQQSDNPFSVYINRPKSQFIELKNTDSDSCNLFDILHKNKEVFVDFSTKTCIPCQQLFPIFKGAAKKYPKVTFVYLDINEYDSLVDSLQKIDVLKKEIIAVPTIVYFNYGEEYGERTIGYYYKYSEKQNKKILEDFIKKNLNL